LCDALLVQEGRSFDEIIKLIGVTSEDELAGSFQFLYENDLIFFTSEPESYPEISTEWHHPYVLSNCILDFDQYDSTYVNQLMKSIGTTPIQNLEIRIFNEMPYGFLVELLENISISGLLSIELISKYSENINNIMIKNVIRRFPRLFTWINHSSPYKDHFSCRSTNFGQVFFTTEVITSNRHCGKIGPEFFTINFSTFNESVNHNSCLNKKISVDVNGAIKNCPSMDESFGNIRTHYFHDILLDDKFKKSWNISKDEIDGCRDCEFRFICTDCRAFLTKPQNILSKPLKCGYNLETGEWKSWSELENRVSIAKYYQIV